MSSETSTEAVGLAPDASPTRGRDLGLQPWQFFVLAALACATALTYLLRGQGLTVVILVSLLMAACGFVGLATLRTIRPLFGEADDRMAVVGLRTRAALEQEKLLSLRTIKELEFDRAMGKISEADFQEMSVRLRARAVRLMRQLDAGDGYRAQIERDIAKRLGEPGSGPARAIRTCAKCSTANDPDARFCKNCGEGL